MKAYFVYRTKVMKIKIIFALRVYHGYQKNARLSTVEKVHIFQILYLHIFTQGRDDR